MMTETTWMDSHKACADGFVDGIVDMGSGVVNASADRTVVLKDAQNKVNLWIERSRRRIERRDKDTSKFAAVAAVHGIDPIPENHVNPPADPGVPAVQLHKRLELIKPRH